MTKTVEFKYDVGDEVLEGDVIERRNVGED